MMKKIATIICVVFVSFLTLYGCGKREDLYKDRERVFCTNILPVDGWKEFDVFDYAEEYGINTKIECKKLSDVKNEVNGIFWKANLDYKESVCSKKSSISDEDGTFYSVYDVYENNLERVMYLHDTDIICSYSAEGGNYGKYEEKSDKEVRQIAENFLMRIMSEKTFSEFELDSFYTASRGMYGVKYVRYMNGYKTDETIDVQIYKTGAIAYYNALELKKYDAFENKVKKAELDSAKAALIKKAEELNLNKVELQEYELVTNTEGKLFMKSGFWYVDEKGLDSYAEIYVNV